MEILAITFLTLLAGILGTITGFGISTVMIPVVLLFLPLGETLLLVGVIHWFGDIWKMLLFKKGFDWKLLAFFGVPGAVAAWYGATLTFEVPEKILSRLVGGILVAYVVFLLAKPHFKLKKSPFVAALGGAGSGLLGGISGVGGGALRSAVLTAFAIPKSTYIFTSGVLGAAIDASRILGYFAGGTRIENNLALGMIFFIPASYIGAKIAKVIVDKIPSNKFRMIIAIFLLALGIKFAIWP